MRKAYKEAKQSYNKTYNEELLDKPIHFLTKGAAWNEKIDRRQQFSQY